MTRRGDEEIYIIFFLLQDLYQLNQYIQESLAREQLLENKILGLQRLLEETEHASQVGWKALMDEDRLLTRVEILESQLTTYGKSMSEDKLREETKRLMEEKENYQNSAKDTLKKIVDDKIEAVNKVKTVEQSLMTLEAEYSSLRQLYDRLEIFHCLQHPGSCQPLVSGQLRRTRTYLRN